MSNIYQEQEQEQYSIKSLYSNKKTIPHSLQNSLRVMSEITTHIDALTSIIQSHSQGKHSNTPLLSIISEIEEGKYDADNEFQKW